MIRAAVTTALLLAATATPAAAQTHPNTCSNCGPAAPFCSTTAAGSTARAGWRPKGEHRLSTVVQVYGNAGGREHWAEAMGIDWMTPKEMTEAVPPAYTEYIGHQLIARAHLRRAA